jgi:hypothetical protein
MDEEIARRIQGEEKLIAEKERAEAEPVHDESA